MKADSKILREIVVTPMPFGRFQGRCLDSLPVSYLEWLARKGFPSGRLGELLQTIYEIKINGLEYLLSPIRDGGNMLQ